MDLTSCWLEFIEGDKAAFQRLYEQTADELFAYGMRMGNDRERVLDCIHDLFVHLYGNKRISREVNVKHYLFASLRRRLLATDKGSFISLFDEDGPAERTDSRESEIIRNETATINSGRLMAQVNQLPKRQREIIHLRYAMDLSYAEISMIMHINVETCRTLCHRAIKVLRSNLRQIELLAAFCLLYFF